MPARSPRHSHPAAWVACILVVALAAVGCSGRTVPSGAVGTIGPASQGPGDSGSGACVAAPAPPASQEGWTTAPSPPTVFPVIVNSGGSLTCGNNRLVMTFLDADDRPVAAPDRTVSMALYDLGRDGATPVLTVDGSFVWGIENERGFYVAAVTFPEAGRWGAEFTTAVSGGAAEKIRMTFDVATSSPVVRVGDAAPASDTPTAASAGGDLTRISTDTHPDPALYETSVGDAIAAHEPFVLVFATPKFCASAQCGPTLDRVKPLAAEFPGVRFIHAEPYELAFADGGLQPVLDAGGSLQATRAVVEWGILSEPWVFVVGRDGIVTASFEGILATEELRSAISAVK